MKPAGWPKHMREKRLSDGNVAYFWAPPTRDIAAGFTLKSEALGRDYGYACERAAALNLHLADWRSGRGTTKELDHQPGFGTLAWLVERYQRTRAWERVSQRSRYEYQRALNLVLDFPLKSGAKLGSASLPAVTPRGVDKLYVALQKGKRTPVRLRQANVCIARMARAWDAVRRLYPAVVPENNPFRGVELEHGKGTTRPASREEAMALHRALVTAGELHLAAIPLIAFEWLQRPENVIAGHLTWADYRPADRPNSVRICHHKTKEFVDLPLSDRSGRPFFPELTAYLDQLERLGVPIVLMSPQRASEGQAGPAKPFLLRTARTRVRRAARAAGLPDDLTLAACRHGGMTELGDAQLTEAGIIALSGHRTADAARGYVKPTEIQREVGLMKRRAWREVPVEEHVVDKSRNAPPAAESE